MNQQLRTTEDLQMTNRRPTIMSERRPINRRLTEDRQKKKTFKRISSKIYEDFCQSTKENDQS